MMHNAEWRISGNLCFQSFNFCFLITFIVQGIVYLLLLMLFGRFCSHGFNGHGPGGSALRRRRCGAGGGETLRVTTWEDNRTGVLNLFPHRWG